MGTLMKTVKPQYLGLCLVHMWIYCTTHRFTFNDDVSVMAVMYAALSLFLILLFALVRRVGRVSGAAAGTGGAVGEAGGGAGGDANGGANGGAGGCVDGFPSRRLGAVLDATAATFMAVCAVLLTAPPAFAVASAAASGATVAVASTLGGVGVAWAYMRWGQFYAKLDIHVAAPLIFVTMAVGSVGKAAIDLLPPVPAAVVLAADSYCALLCMRRSLAMPPATPEPVVFYTSRTVRSLLRLAAGIAVYSLTTGVIQSMLLETSTVPAGAVLVHHGSEVVLGVAMALWVAKLRRGLDFSRTWRLILVLMGTALIFEPHFSADAMMYLLSLIRTAQTFLIVFLFLALADIARHSPYHPMAVFTLGWASYSLPFMVGKVVGDGLVSFGPGVAFVSSAIVWVLLVVMLFVLDDASAGNRLIFVELRDEGEEDTLAERMGAVQRELDAHQSPAAPEHDDPLTLRCAKLSEANRLTPREQEILEMLVRGRSKAHIAEAFRISVNTVRGHVTHIYAKLGVHGKQELVDLVEAVQL